MYKVYLSGPITGLTYDEGDNWRQAVTYHLEHDFDARGTIPHSIPGVMLSRSNVQCLNPLRAHEFLRRLGKLDDDNYLKEPESFLVTDEFIGTRDWWDTTRADAIFVNFLGAKRVSIGTVLEIGMAHAARVPVITVMEPKGNVHDHCMVRNYTTLRFDDLDKAVLATKAMFCV